MNRFILVIILFNFLSCSSQNDAIKPSEIATNFYYGADLSYVNEMQDCGAVYKNGNNEIKNVYKIFKEAGFEWREPGCSMCLAMNDDVLGPGERCASSTNRNFEGRQGRGGRTHLMSPAMVAAAAVAGYLADVRSVAGA